MGLFNSISSIFRGRDAPLIELPVVHIHSLWVEALREKE